MSNSSLVNYTALSPNHYNGRNHAIDKVTIHHMAGNLSVEQCGNVFANSNANASSNYGIGTDGRVGLYVDESNAAWTSSNYANDNRAVTIEVANDGGSGWSVSGTAYNKLIDLCVDICQRNGIGALTWTGDTTGTLTVHRMFAATACPGDYLYARMPEIAAAVTARLSGEKPAATKEDELKAINIPKGNTDVYRLYNPNNGQHMYTTSTSERDGMVKAGWQSEGVGWTAADTGEVVYRLYNPNTGDHMFTVSYDEAKGLVDAGWTYEGANFASARSGKEVYRLYNSSTGQHIFTASMDERDGLVDAGWKNEGTAFYGA
jgi:hypothetical protein